MTQTKSKCPPCPKCGTEMVAWDNWYDCLKCHATYSSEAWKIRDRQQKVIDDPKQPRLL